MFRKTKFFTGMFLISIFILVLMYGFTAGTWRELDISKELLFEVNINRIFAASRYTLAVVPALSTIIFLVTLILVTKDEKIDDTEPFVIKKLMCILMIELIISQFFIQYLLVRRSINIILPQSQFFILTIMGVVVSLTALSLVLYIITKHFKNRVK